jgi:hypothetical protein
MIQADPVDSSPKHAPADRSTGLLPPEPPEDAGVTNTMLKDRVAAYEAQVRSFATPRDLIAVLTTIGILRAVWDQAEPAMRMWMVVLAGATVTAWLATRRHEALLGEYLRLRAEGYSGQLSLPARLVSQTIIAAVFLAGVAEVLARTIRGGF